MDRSNNKMHATADGTWGWLECTGDSARAGRPGRRVGLSVGSETLLGRKEECELCYPKDSAISSQHAVLYFTEASPSGAMGAKAWVEDLSVNGTFLNGVRVGKGLKLELFDNDELTLLRAKRSGGPLPPYTFKFHANAALLPSGQPAPRAPKKQVAAGAAPRSALLFSTRAQRKEPADEDHEGGDAFGDPSPQPTAELPTEEAEMVEPPKEWAREGWAHSQRGQLTGQAQVAPRRLHSSILTPAWEDSSEVYGGHW